MSRAFIGLFCMIFEANMCMKFDMGFIDALFQNEPLLIMHKCITIREVIATVTALMPLLFTFCHLTVGFSLLILAI